MDRRKRNKKVDTSPAGTASGQFVIPEAAQQQQQRQQHQLTTEQHEQADAAALRQQHQLQELPEAVLTQIVLAGGTQRHLHGVLAAVCQDWRTYLLQSTKQLSVGLTSQTGAASLALWLSKHAADLEQLHMATVGLFGRNCDNDTRLRLFQSLHRAAAGAAADGSPAPGSQSQAVNSSGSQHSPQQDHEGAEYASPSSVPAAAAAGSNSRRADLGSPLHSSDRQQQQQPSSSADFPDGSSSSAEEEVTASPMLQPVPGGLFAGCAHLATPSPSGDLFAAAAAAAGAAMAAAAAANAAAATRAGLPPGSHLQQHESQQQAQQRRQQSQSQPQQEEQQAQDPQHQQDQTEQQQQQQQALVPEPRELQLQQLSANMRLTPADCAAIASLPAPHLRSLWLQGSRTRRLSIEGVRCLAAMTALTSLKLQQFSIGDDATVLLAKGLTSLQLLCLCGNNIGAAGAAAIGQYCTKLEQLDLSINRINAAALASICGSLHCLKDLNLSGNGHLDAAALQHLQSLTVLSHLTISSSSLTNADLTAVCSALPQLQSLDAGNNRITKADTLTGLVSLTSLNLSRNPLQLNCSKVLAALPLQALALFDAVPARAVSQLAGSAGSVLTQQLTSLTLGADPSTNAEGTDEGLQLAKTRTCGVLFGALAEAARLQVLSVPCTGLGDAQAKLLSKLGGSLQVLNISYNCLTPAGLKVLRDLPQLERLELRAMRPELTDAATAHISSCSKLTHLDLAHNDITSEGVKQLGCPALAHLQHLDLRNNAQVEKWSVLAAANHLTRLTHVNLMEISDVRARAFPRPTKPGLRAAAGPGAGSGLSPSKPAAAAAAGGGGLSPLKGSRGRASTAAAATAAAAAAASGGGQQGGSVSRAHADVWAALPNLEELQVEAQSECSRRGGRFFSIL